MLLRSPGPISPDTYSGHIRRRALCPNRLRNGMSQRSSSSRQSDILPTMVGPSKSRPPMSHRKTDLGIPCRSKSAKVVLGGVSQIGLRIVTRHQVVYRFGPLLPWSREIAVAVHHEPRPSVELLVLQVASREIGAQQIPGELEQLHALLR